MSMIKDEMIKVIMNQPEDSSFEEILSELRLVSIINKGLKESKANKTIPHAQLEEEIKKWHM